MKTRYPGTFISCEGIDGSGKTTSAKFLVQTLKDKGYEVVHTREPGGTIIAEEIRNILLTKRENEHLTPLAELLLFSAARAQHIEAVIKPALLAGKIVVCDRFSDSTFAYQGIGRGYVDEVLELEILVHKGFEPKFTLFFDVTMDESINRINSRNEVTNRLDDESIVFKAKVFKGYHHRKEIKKHRMHVINAMCSIEEVQCQITQWIDKHFVK